MKAAVLAKVGADFSIEDVSISRPQKNEVLLQTAASGVCHSDLHLADGSLPMVFPAVLGHEGSAVVLEVGEDVTYVKKGDHVITSFTGFCGHCGFCMEGKSVHCSSPSMLRRPKTKEPRLSLNGKKLTPLANLGTFAETMLMHENNVVRIDKEMPLDRAALIGCGVTTGVGAVFNTAKVRPGDSVCVIGCGGLGLSAINAAAISGASRIVAVDIFDSKLELAKSMGATDLINSKEQDPIEAVLEMTKGGVKHAFEGIGLEETLRQAIGVLAPLGTVTVMGVFKYGSNVSIPASDFLQEKKIQGTYMGSGNPRTQMPQLVDLYLKGKLHLDLLISKRLKLQDINQAFLDLKKGGAARSVIVF